MTGCRLWCAVGFTGVVFLYATVATVLAQDQLPNLPDTPAAPRFPVTDRVWPATPGGADICLWADDKTAAMSFTVDDISPANTAWWLEMCEQYGGFKVTWFMITSELDNTAGPWSQCPPLLALGHDVQSHTVHHINSDAEYRDSQIAIEQNIPGHKCDVLAYPGGIAAAGPTDRASAIKYFAAARGASGRINPANQIDYFNTSAMSSVLTTNDPSVPRTDLSSLLNKDVALYYRGWVIRITHGVYNFEDMRPMFEFFAAHKDELWGGTFGEVAKYGQERDTATLTVISNTAERVVMTLTDQMLDSRFNYPLTIKVRINDIWPGVNATQAGAPVESKLIEHGGGRYALVKAVPDQGDILLTAGTSVEFTATPTSGWTPLTVSFTDTSTIIGITNRVWDFGDGITTNTTEITVTHIYTSAGTNTVQLIVSGATEAGTNTQSGLIHVTLPVAPSAGFTVFPASGAVPLPVAFTDTSTGSITNRFWDFGDGTTTNTLAVSVSHIYASTGTNTVRLIVSGPVGVSTSTQGSAVIATVPVVPVASFTVSPSSGTAPLNVSFTDTSTGTITNRFWDFGDGMTADDTAAGVTHTYAVAGTSTVQLIVSGPVGSSTNTQAGLISVAAPFSQGLLLVEEHFNSPSGPLFGTTPTAGGTWTTNAQAGLTGYSIVSGGLTAPSGFAAASGTMTKKMGVSGGEYQTAFAAQTNGTIYYSLLLNVPAILANKASEVCALTLNDGSDYASIRYAHTNSESFYTLGVTYRNAVSNRMGTTQLTAGSTHLVVVSYQMNSGFLNDVVNFWLDPDASTFGNGTAPTPLLTLTGAQSDATSLNMFELNNSSATPAGMLFDELRVGTNWASVVPATVSAPAGDADNDGIPDSWETQYFGGSTNASPNVLAANGRNTIYEMYIAGLDPTNAQAAFAVSGGPNAASMQWNSVSGRVYSVYWTTNLLSGFQPLETNMVWPQNSWTNMMHGAQGGGFYQLRVRLNR